jgi:hypothetical protein
VIRKRLMVVIFDRAHVSAWPIICESKIMSLVIRKIIHLGKWELVPTHSHPQGPLELFPYPITIVDACLLQLCS